MSPLFGVCALLFCATALVAAQEVEVSSVRFDNVRPPADTSDAWLEADIVLQARPDRDRLGNMVPRVRVTLLAGFEVPGRAGRPRRVEYYRSQAECIALEPGRSDVRFYLPPEIVKRDQLHGDPKFWLVELAIAGEPVPPAHNATSQSLGATLLRADFLKRLEAAAPANDGILVPQYLTPFAHAYPRATPTFIRRESS